MNDKVKSKKNYWLIEIVFLALGLISLLIFQLVLANQTLTKKNCEGVEIEMFRTQLALLPTDDLENRKTSTSC